MAGTPFAARDRVCGGKDGAAINLITNNTPAGQLAVPAAGPL